MRPADSDARAVRVPAGEVDLAGDLGIPEEARGVVVFAHGSGSSRLSPRNRSVAQALRNAGVGTLLMDLLTPDEEEAERYTRHLRFDIPLLARRLGYAIRWLGQEPETRELPIGCFGASTGAAAALIAAADFPDSVKAVVSRGGRPDLAGDALERVEAPSLFIVAVARLLEPTPRWSTSIGKPWRSCAAPRSSGSSPAQPICSRSRARSRPWRVWRRNGSASICAHEITYQQLALDSDPEGWRGRFLGLTTLARIHEAERDPPHALAWVPGAVPWPVALASGGKVVEDECRHAREHVDVSGVPSPDDRHQPFYGLVLWRRPIVEVEQHRELYLED